MARSFEDVYAVQSARIEELEKDNAALRNMLAAIAWLVNKQASDNGLWFKAQYASEAYLQQELRKLHAAIEQAKALAGK